MTQRLKAAVVCSSLVLLLALVLPASAQDKSDVASVPFSSAPYRIGERLTYNVSFSNFISAAHVELQVAARGAFFGREGIQLRGHVETTGVIYATLFAINNDYTTYVDPETGLPFRAQQTLREASRSSDRASDFNQPSGLAAIPGKSTSGESLGTYDFLSALYRLRSLPLGEGSAYYFSVRDETLEYEAELRVTGRQVIKTNVGSFNTLVSQVHVRNNSQINSYNLKIYFSDDERHVPVLITARHSAGEIRADLAASEFVFPPISKPSSNAVIVAQSPSQSRPAAGTPAMDNGALENLPFKVGEQLNYQIFLGNIAQPAATVSFQIRAHSRYFNRDGLLFAVDAQTTNAIQGIFFANDKISSYADPHTLLPFRTESTLAEGRRRLNQALTINQDHGMATSDKGEKIEIPVGTHDYLSFFYALRTFNLSPPKRNAISILVNNKPKTLVISALKRETIQLGSQSIPAIQISLTTVDPQADKYELRAWISDDDRRLPLRLLATTGLGPLRADLAIIPVTPQ